MEDVGGHKLDMCEEVSLEGGGNEVLEEKKSIGSCQNYE